MIRKLDKTSIDMCCGCAGECQCMGTGDHMENVFGPFRSIQESEHECMRWCIETKKGTKWRFLPCANPISLFGFGGDWHVVGAAGHIKTD